MSKADKKRKRIKRGLKRALITFAAAFAALFVLNYGADYITGLERFKFMEDKTRLWTNLTIVVLTPVVAYASAFKPRRKDGAQNER